MILNQFVICKLVDSIRINVSLFVMVTIKKNLEIVMDIIIGINRLVLNLMVIVGVPFSKIEYVAIMDSSIIILVIWFVMDSNLVDNSSVDLVWVVMGSNSRITKYLILLFKIWLIFQIIVDNLMFYLIISKEFFRIIPILVSIIVIKLKVLDKFSK